MTWPCIFAAQPALAIFTKTKPSLMKSKLILLSSVTLLAGLLATKVSASVTIGSHDNIQVGGFFSQGYISSSGNNYPFENKDGTADFREMGVNVSGTVGTHLRVGAQLFAQRLGNYGDDSVKLDWAVADYNVCQEFGVRVGRVKYPKGLYGEALDLDVIRPYIFLPMSLYNPVVRDFNSSFNGGMIYGTIGAGRGGSVDYKAFYGKIPMSPDQGVADFFNTTSLYASPGVSHLGMDYTAGSQLVWNTPVTGLKAAYSYSFFNNLDATGKFALYPVAGVDLFTKKYSYNTLSLEYARDSWTLAAEWQTVGGDFSVITPFGTSLSKNRVTNWSLAVARRLGERLEAGAYFSTQRNTNPSAGSRSADNHNDDWTLSLRYDVNEHLTVKAEGHYIDGTYNVFNTVRTPNPAIRDHSSFYAVKTTFSF